VTRDLRQPSSRLGALACAVLSCLAAAQAGAAGRIIAAADATIARGASGTVSISLAAQGDENALGFSVTFDPALLSYSSYTAGSGAGGATINVNDTQKLAGKIGVILALPAGQTFAAGARELVQLTIAAAGGASTVNTPIAFGDSPVAREISDATANVLTATFQGGTLTLQGSGGGGTRTISAANATITRGATGEVKVSLAAQGDENALGFSVTFDPVLLTYTSFAAGSGTTGATVNLNESQKAAGKLGVVMALPAGQTFAAGTKELVKLTFAAAAGTSTVTTPVAFGDMPVAREISDATASVLIAAFQGATVTLQANEGCSGPYDLIIPAAAHSNGVWQSDVDLLNDGTGDAKVDIALLKQGQANPNPLIHSVEVPPGQSVRIVDILGSVLPAANAALGIRFCQGEVLANSRFYNIGKGAGTFGMWVPGLPESATVTPAIRGTFHLLTYATASTSGFRVNIGVANAQATSAAVVIRLYGDDGLQIGQAVTRTLRAFEQVQYTKIHQSVGSGNVDRGWATVEVTTPGAKVHAYAMLIDNKSSDPIYMPAELR
jgi:hypothetical protein